MNHIIEFCLYLIFLKKFIPDNGPEFKNSKLTGSSFIKAGMNQHSAVFSDASQKPCFSLETAPQARGITNPDIRTAPKRGNPSRLSGILAERIKKNMISIKNQSFPAFNSAAGRTHLLKKWKKSANSVVFYWQSNK